MPQLQLKSSSRRQTRKRTRKYNLASIPPEYNKTYIISHGTHNALYFPILANILNSYGLKRSNDPKSHPVFLNLNLLETSRYDHQYYNTPSMIFNILNDSKRIITDKYTLYNTFYQQFPQACNKYMARSWNTKTFLAKPNLLKRITTNHEVMIVKPIGTGAMGGKGISIVNDKTSLDRALQKIAKYGNSMISEYITNPYLFEGKKFHIRAYYLVFVSEDGNSREVRTKLFPFGKILTAKDPYINGEYNNPDIHDTHFESTGRDIYFPADLPSEMHDLFMREVIPGMTKCLRFVSEIISPVIQKYNNCKYGYEVFGCDFMITTNANQRVKLLEINDKVGYLNASRDKAKELSKLFFSEINDGIIEPILGYNDIYHNLEFWDYRHPQPI